MVKGITYCIAAVVLAAFAHSSAWAVVVLLSQERVVEVAANAGGCGAGSEPDASRVQAPDFAAFDVDLNASSVAIVPDEFVCSRASASAAQNSSIEIQGIVCSASASMSQGGEQGPGDALAASTLSIKFEVRTLTSFRITGSIVGSASGWPLADGGAAIEVENQAGVVMGFYAWCTAPDYLTPCSRDFDESSFLQPGVYELSVLVDTSVVDAGNASGVAQFTLEFDDSVTSVAAMPWGIVKTHYR